MNSRSNDNRRYYLWLAGSTVVSCIIAIFIWGLILHWWLA